MATKGYINPPQGYIPSAIAIQAAKVLCKVYHGLYHVGDIKDNIHWAEADVHGDLATTDFAKLTELVIAAHDDCVRISISPSGPGLLKLLFHHRNRDGAWDERHPEMEEHIEAIREGHAFENKRWDNASQKGDEFKRQIGRHCVVRKPNA